MKVAIGCDHAGYETKEFVKKALIEKGYVVTDCGTNSKESCNYASFALDVAKLVASQEDQYGVLICNSGEGVCIAANKVKGVMCGIGYNDEVSRLLRTHNDANVIAFGAGFMSKEDILNRALVFLSTDFEGGRHKLRVNTIKDYEEQN